MGMGENYLFTFRVEMEFMIVKFSFLGKRCFLPLILNSNDIYKRFKENQILEVLVKNLEKTNGITDVRIIHGGINTEEGLSQTLDNFLAENEHQKVQYLDFYKRTLDDNSDGSYSKHINIKYKGIISLPVKVINNEKDLEEFGPMPLPIILIE